MAMPHIILQRGNSTLLCFHCPIIWYEGKWKTAQIAKLGRLKDGQPPKVAQITFKSYSEQILIVTFDIDKIDALKPEDIHVRVLNNINYFRALRFLKYLSRK